jgi:serine/threonine-protein kinase
MLQVSDAVGEAHAQGIVHRDLKPENVMLVRRGDDSDFAKVLDFGVARIDWSDNSVATQAGVIFGTARYISPEGARGTQVGAAGDVYSLATILFQCLSGETPFNGDNPVAILLKHTTEAPPDVRSRPRSSYVPEPIARVILSNLAKDPADRCRDGREFARALIEAARVSGLHASESLLHSRMLTGGGALALASMERTKALNLSPETAQRLAQAPLGAGQTQIDDESEAAADRASTGSGATQVMDSPPASVADAASEAAAGTASERPRTPTVAEARTSLVDPTLVEEPAVSRLTPAPPSDRTISRLSHPDTSRISVPPRPSAPEDSWTPPHDEGPRWRRLFVVAGCFVVGVGLTLFIAYRLGAFAAPVSELELYRERARAALAARAYAAPAPDNVKDITDTALRRWPGAPAIVAVRRDAARQVLSEARLSIQDRATAERLVALSLELDPSNDEAREFQARLASAENPPKPRALPEHEPRAQAAPRKPPVSPPRSKPAMRQSEKPKAAPKPEPPPEPAAPQEPAATAPAGGRWL